MKKFLLLILIFLSGCLVKRNIFHDPHFYYDKENYTLIRVNPETREEDIEEYFNRKNKPSTPTSLPNIEKDSLELWTPPKPKKIVRPDYPSEAKSMGYYGTVILKLLIDSTGVVLLAKPVSSFMQGKKLDRIETLLVKSALEAAIQTTFKPACDDKGKPVPVWVSFSVRFVLERNKKKRFPPSLVP